MGTAATFAGPSGIALDSSGDVYVASSASATIREVTPDGTVTTIVGVPGRSEVVLGVSPRACPCLRASRLTVRATC